MQEHSMPTNFVKHLGLAAGIWASGAVLYSAVEALMNAATGLYFPLSVFAQILVVYGLAGLLGGASLASLVFAWQRWRKKKELHLGAFYTAAFFSAFLFVYLSVPLNVHVLPSIRSPLSVIGNTLLLGCCVAAGMLIYRHLGSMTPRGVVEAFLGLSLSVSCLLSAGLYLDTFVLARFSASQVLLFYPVLSVGGFVVYGLGYQILRGLRRVCTEQWPFVAKRAVSVVFLFVIGGVWAVSIPRTSVSGATTGKQRPNVVWIVMDTTRADHLSAYGYQRQTTPHIDQIAQEGILFENAIAPSSWTMPSHFQMVTSRFAAGKINRLDEGAITAAEIFQQEGYRTGAVLANALLGRQSGFRQGFETFIDGPPVLLYLRVLKRTSVCEFLLKLRFLPSRPILRLLDRRTFLTTGRANADAINRHVFQWLEEPSSSPFFLFINYMDPHDPYDPPERFKERFAADVNPELGFIKYRRETGKFVSANEFVRDTLPRMATTDWQDIIALYDAELAFLDDQIGAVVAKLKELDVYGQTIVVITSDHGELFGEHDLALHLKALTEEEIRVPLIMRYPPKLSPGRVRTPVHLVDVLPTLLDLLDLTPRHAMDGKRLPLTDTPGGTSASQPGVYSFLIRKPDPQFPHTMPGHLITLRTGEWKYIWSSTGQHAYYDLEADPKELENRYNPGRAELLEIAQQLETWRGEIGLEMLGEDSSLDRLTKDRLRSLGYIQ